MNLKHTIRKVLKENRIKILINPALRRLSDVGKFVDMTSDWVISHINHKVLKEAGIEWFVERVIYNFYIDYISQIFEDWGEQGELEYPEMTISEQDENNIRKFLKKHYYERIKKRYIDEFGEEEKVPKKLTESEIPIKIRRRLQYNEDNVINYLKKFALRYAKDEKFTRMKKDIGLDWVVRNACRDTAYELLSNTELEFGDDYYSTHEDVVSDYLKEKYGEQIKEYIKDFYEESGDELDSRYVFEKHSERYGGNGFSEGHETWNKLLRKFADWFPDLDWKELKTKLDNMNSGGKILIKKPGDINNAMGYYFSLQRFDR